MTRASRAEREPVELLKVLAAGMDPANMRRFATAMQAELRIEVDVVREPRSWWETHVDSWVGTFPSWPWARPGEKRFVDAMSGAVHFARALERYTPDKGNVTLLGSTGVGKTLAVVALANRFRDSVVAAGETCRSAEARMIRRSYFVRVAELARAMREHSLGAELAPKLRRAMSATWAVLDDLGNEPPGFEPMALEILDERYHRRRVTFVTSGFTRKQLSARYGDALLRRLIEPAGAIFEAWPGGPGGR